VVRTVTEQPKPQSLDELPLDEELIRDSVDAALEMGLSTSTRKDIDATISVLIGHLNLLLTEDLGPDDGEKAKGMRGEAYKHLDLKHRPSGDTAAFSAFAYMRSTALLTRRFLEICAERSGTGAH